jgi:hypothetical protein
MNAHPLTCTSATVLGAAVTVQIATTASGATSYGPHPAATITAGLLALAVVMTWYLLTARGLSAPDRDRVHRAVCGTTPVAATGYTLALGAALWSAAAGSLVLTVVSAMSGALAYTLAPLYDDSGFRPPHGAGLLTAVATIAGLGILLVLAS